MKKANELTYCNVSPETVVQTGACWWELVEKSRSQMRI